jgi:hypothetical protein
LGRIMNVELKRMRMRRIRVRRDRYIARGWFQEEVSKRYYKIKCTVREMHE